MCSQKQEKIGGIALYLSLIALLLIAVSNSAGLVTLLVSFDVSSLANLLIFVLVSVLGFFFCAFLIPEKALVFMHETKHAVLSGLAGNRWKKMHIETDSGHFEYAYSKKTAHFNAMIALAPYFFPLLSIPTIAVCAAAFYDYHRIMIAFVSFAYGIDLFSNIRDIDPRQTDFSVIRGGFFVGFAYVVLANLVFLSLLIAWCSFNLTGIKHLALTFWHFVETIVAWRLLLTSGQ